MIKKHDNSLQSFGLTRILLLSLTHKTHLPGSPACMQALTQTRFRTDTHARSLALTYARKHNYLSPNHDYTLQLC